MVNKSNCVPRHAIIELFTLENYEILLANNWILEIKFVHLYKESK